MKRINDLFDCIAALPNLELADAKARMGKKSKREIMQFDLDRSRKLADLHKQLLSASFKTSPYQTFEIFEPKQRTVYKLPYYPDRIVHHAILNILEPIFTAQFTADTYSCIRGKGIHAAAKKLKASLRNTVQTTYCLKFDIVKFYPSVNGTILKNRLRDKFKDTRLLQLLDEIIDSATGLPIGNYLSQYFANFYLSKFDHWVKENKGVKYYFRYADDIVILTPDKTYLRQIFSEIETFLQVELDLQIKGNYQIFPVASRGIDFIGYKFYHTHTLLRKSIKQNFARAISKGAGNQSIASYLGWAKHANCSHLLKKLLPNVR